MKQKIIKYHEWYAIDENIWNIRQEWKENIYENDKDEQWQIMSRTRTIWITAKYI
jgi:hypothetical protein